MITISTNGCHVYYYMHVHFSVRYYYMFIYYYNIVLECAVPLLALACVPALVVWYLASSPGESQEIRLLQLSPPSNLFLYPSAHPVCLQPTSLRG